MNRRDFIRTSALFTSYLFLWGCRDSTGASGSGQASTKEEFVSQNELEAESQDETVLVIGAGMAGLAAA